MRLLICKALRSVSSYLPSSLQLLNSACRNCLSQPTWSKWAGTQLAVIRCHVCPWTPSCFPCFSKRRIVSSSGAEIKTLFFYRQRESPLLHGLPVLLALYDLLDDLRLHLLWVIKKKLLSYLLSHVHVNLTADSLWPQTGGSTVPPVMPRMDSGSISPRSPPVPPGCFGCSSTASSTSCGWPCSSCASSTRSGFTLCARVLKKPFHFPVCWPFRSDVTQIAALGITTNERMNARRYKHFKVTATSIESPFK